MTDRITSPSDEDAILLELLDKVLVLAERNMSERMRRAIEPAEMAQTIIASVIRLARSGKISVSNDQHWKLLLTIALCKIRAKWRYMIAQCRDSQRVVTLGPDVSLAEIAVDVKSSPDSVGASLAETIEELCARLDEDCRKVLMGRLEGRDNLEIARSLGKSGKSTRTVTRCWNLIEQEARKIGEACW